MVPITCVVVLSIHINMQNMVIQSHSLLHIPFIIDTPILLDFSKLFEMRLKGVSWR